MAFVLGIDGGGTGTRAVVLDEQGRLCGVGWGGPANYDDVGEQQAQANIGAAVEAACRAAGVEKPFDAAFLGLAGVVSPKDRVVVRRIAANLKLAAPERVGVDHDCRVALAGGLTGRPGIVLIAGTGSSCYGRNAHGESWRAGGWGDLVGDEGSGYWLGVRAMRAAVRVHDGRGPETVLAEYVKKRLALSEMNDLMHRLYVEGLSRAETAALAPLVFDAVREGDAEARALIREGAEELADCVLAVATRLNLDEGSSELALVGGLLKAGDVFTQPLRAAVRERLPCCRVKPPELPPVLGAGLLALKHLDVSVMDSIERALHRGAEQLKESKTKVDT